MIAPSCGRIMVGMMSSRGSEDMITPAACTPHCRLRPSRPLAVSTTFLTSGSELNSARNSPPSEYRSWLGSKILLSGTSLPCTGGGITLVMRSPTANGMPSTRAASLTACLALIVP